MERSVKSQLPCWYWLAKTTRHSLISLLSVVLLSQSVGATQKSQRLQIAQQPENTQQDATRAAAEKLTQ